MKYLIGDIAPVPILPPTLAPPPPPPPLLLLPRVVEREKRGGGGGGDLGGATSSAVRRFEILGYLALSASFSWANTNSLRTLRKY